MLKVLRDNLRYLSWVLWLVIIVFVGLAFVEFGTVGPADGPRTAAASVGREEISYAQFQRQYQATEQQYRDALGDQFSQDMIRQLRLPIQVLDRLINQRILVQEAERLDLRATDEEVREAILEFPVFRDDAGRFVGPDLYERILRANGYTVADFEQEMRDQILLDKLMGMLRQTLRVDATEVERAYREDVERARIRYVQVSPDRLRDEVEVEPEALTAFFEERREEYRLPEQRIVDYLLVDTARVRTDLELDDEELRDYYQRNPQEFTRDEEVRARHILVTVDEERSEQEAREMMARIEERLAAGEDFSELARELSEDPGSRDRGGDLGYFGRGQMIREFEEVAFTAEPGQVAGPVRTAFGLHLLEVLDRREGGLQPFEEARSGIESQIRSERAAELTEQKARQVAEQVRGHDLTGPQALETFAEGERVVHFNSTPPIGRDDPVPGIGRETPFSARAFELVAGEISEPVRIPRGWAVLQVREVMPPSLPELAEVESRVREDFIQARAEELTAGRLDEIRARLDAGEDLEQVARDLDLSTQEPDRFGPQGIIEGLGVNRALARLALTLDEGEIGGPVEARGGPVVFRVTERRLFDPEEFAREKEATRALVEQEKLDRLLASLIEKRRQELRVSYDRQLLESFELDEPV